MDRKLIILSAAVAGVAGFVWWQNRNREAWARWPAAVSGTAGGIVAAIEGAFSGMGIVKISNMRTVDRGLVNNRNVRAMFAVIRRGEGTGGPNGYRTLYGGGLFDSFADHPRRAITKWGWTSTAAGAYQLLAKVWDETRAAMGLVDFSPASQDLAALGRIAARGALTDVLDGRFDAAIAKLNREWASLPGSPYGQGTISAETARQVYAAAGGMIEGAVIT